MSVCWVTRRGEAACAGASGSGREGGLGLGAGATVGEKRLAGPWLRPRLSRSFGSVLYGVGPGVGDFIAL